MQPDLSISYDSGSGNGLMGVGFALNGLSQITVCRRTLAQDEKNSAATTTPDDALCLDGDRLIPVSGTGGNGTVYRTERDTFAKVTRLETGTSGPDSFEIRTKDGRIHTYGGGSNSIVSGLKFTQVASMSDQNPPTAVSAGEARYAWLIHKTVDRSGNSMTYQYAFPGLNGFSDQSIPVIDSIQYTGFGSTDNGQRLVKFIYDPDRRSDPVFSYVGGLELANVVRLKEIHMYGPAPGLNTPTFSGNATMKQLRQYVLAYEASPMNGRSRLITVTDCDGAGVCKAPIQFTWTDGDDTFGQRQDFALSAGDSFYENFESSFMVGDINGDGRDDLIYFATEHGPPYPGTMRPFVGVHISGHVPTNDLYWVLNCRLAGSDGTFGPEQIIHGTAGNRFLWQWRGDFVPATVPIDIDMDGKVELAMNDLDVSPLSAWFVRRIVTQPDGSLRLQDVFADPFPDDTAIYRPYFADLNGDGLPDLFRRIQNTDQTFSWSVAFNQNGTLSAPIPVSAATTSSQVMVGRVRGDSTTSLLLQDIQTGSNDMFTDTRLSAVSAQGTSPVYLGLTLPASSTPLPNTASVGYYFGDFNGDGLADAYTILNSVGTAFLNTGLGHTQFKSTTTGGAFTDIGVYQKFRGQTQIMDFDQDGIDDILLLGLRAGMTGASPISVIVPRENMKFWNSISLETDDNKIIPPSSSFSATGDFNGDGLTDILTSSFDVQGLEIHTYIRNGEKADQLKTITDGLGATVNVAYQPSTVRGAVANDCAYPVTCIKTGPWVVSDIDSDNGQGMTLHDEYTFDGPKSDLTGRGWLGFSSRTVKHFGADHARLLSTAVSTYDNATYVGSASGYHFFKDAGLPGIETTTIDDSQSGRTTVRIRSTTYDTVVGSIGLGQTFFIAPTLQTVKELEYPTNNPVALETMKNHSTTFGYDFFGNCTNQQTTYPDLNETTSTISTYMNDDVAWLISQSTSVTVTSTAGSLSSTHSTITVRDPSTGVANQAIVQSGGGADEQMTTTFVRNTFGLPITVTSIDLKGQSRSQQLTYDDDGTFPASDTNALGQVRRHVIHPGLGVFVMEFDENGLKTSRTYDGFGRIRSETLPIGGGTTSSYKPGESGAVYEVVDSRNGGGSTVVSFDSLNRPVLKAMLNFDGQTFSHVATTYDQDFPRMVSTSTVPQTVLTAGTPRASFSYDSLGRVLTRTAPEGTVTTKTYVGLTTTTTDPKENARLVIADQKGRIVQTIDVAPMNDPDGPHNIITKFTYAPFDLLATTTDTNGNVVTKSYDDLRRVTAQDDPDTGHTDYRYNAFGELRETTDANKEKRTLKHDALGRTIKETSSDGVAIVGWDGAPNGIGSMAMTISPDGTTQQFGYHGSQDAGAGLLSSETWTIPGDHLGAGGYQIDSNYDGFGRLAATVYPAVVDHGRLQVVRAYGANGSLANVSRDGVALWTVTARDDLNRVKTELTHGGDQTETDYFVDSGLVQHIATSDGSGAGMPLRSLDYTYDPDRNLSTRIIDGGPAEVFRYDHLNRLSTWLQASDAGGNGEGTVFRYDDIGNLKRRADQSFSGGIPSGVEIDAVTFTPGDGTTNGPHQVVAASYGSFTYDARGDQRMAPGRTVTYTSFKLPRRIQTPSEDVHFLYDVSHGRVWRDRAKGVLITVGGLYEKQFEASETTHHMHVLGDGRVIADVTWEENGGTVTSDKTTYLHGDHLGSVEAITDESGAVVQRLMYDPYGQRVVRDGSNSLTRIGFTGQETDDDIDLVDMAGRLYDPKLARFISADPLVAATFYSQSYNRYAYVYDNPLNNIDPSGFSPSGKLCVRTQALCEDETHGSGQSDQQTSSTTDLSSQPSTDTTAGDGLQCIAPGASGDNPSAGNGGVSSAQTPNDATDGQSSGDDQQTGTPAGLKGGSSAAAGAVAVGTAVAFSEESVAVTFTEVAEAFGDVVGGAVLGVITLVFVPTDSPSAPVAATTPGAPTGSDVEGPTTLEMGKQSGKEKADDVPSWAKGNQPAPGENGKDFADRVMTDRFGPDWRETQKTGPASDYNKIKKWGDRGFSDK